MGEMEGWSEGTVGGNESMTEYKTSEVVVPEVEDILPTTRASVALDYVIINEKNNNNKYITSFCQQKEILQTLDRMVYRSKAVKQLMNVNGLKKEITEIYGALTQLEHCLSRQDDNSKEMSYCVPCTVNTNDTIGSIHGASYDPMNIDNNQPLQFPYIRKYASQLVIYDVCSGKGVGAFLLSLMFPDLSKIVCIDSNPDIKSSHFDEPECHSMVEFVNLDIHSESFANFLSNHIMQQQQPQAQAERIPVIIGLHLCGMLSFRMIHLFNMMTDIPILIMSPCCMPPRSKKNNAENKVAKTRDMLKRNKWDSYTFWTLNLFTLIDACLSVKNVIRDENVLSEKSTFLVAIKKSFLNRASRQ